VDVDPRTPSGITAETTLGELASWVGPAPTEPAPTAPAPTDQAPTRAAVRPLGDDLDINTGVDDQHWTVTAHPADVADEARARQAPYIALGVTATIGYGLCGADNLAALVGSDIHSVLLTGTIAGTALAVPVLASVVRQRIPELWRRRWWLGTTAAAGWIDATVANGPTWTMLGVLVVGTATISARWAAEHELPNPGDIPEPAPTAVLPPPPRPKPDRNRATLIEQAWRARVAAGRNAIAAGSRLTGRQELPNGTRWTVELDPEGNTGCTDLISAPVRIARPLQVNPHHVIIERLEGVDDREDLASLTVVTKDLLAEGVRYEGPRYRDGRIRFGMRADGAGPAEWVAYDGTGVRGGLIAGGQGSGKSTLLGALGIAYRTSGEWHVLFGDGDIYGNSSHLLKKVAHDFAAGPGEVLQQLEALEAWYEYRGVLLPGLTTGPDGTPVRMINPEMQEPVDWIKPCRAYPGMIWVLDELYRLAVDPDLKAVGFIKRAAALQRILRKLGGAIIAGTQSLLGEDFGGDSAFRGMLAQGNLIALRTENKNEKHVVGDFGISPNTLPKGGGYAISNDGTGTALIRTEYSDDMARWATNLPDLASEDQSAQVYARYRARKKADPIADFHRQQRERARWEEALTSGAPLPNQTAKAAKAAAAAVAGVPEGQVTTIGGVAVPQAPPRRLAVVPDATTPSGPVKVTPLAALGPLTTKARQVLETLQSRPGPWRTRDLSESTGLARPDVSKALAALVDRGLARRSGDVQGVHEATPAAAQKLSS
jgi:hypothetical protein